jgi:hypothetical protein
MSVRLKVAIVADSRTELLAWIRGCCPETCTYGGWVVEADSTTIDVT